MMDNQCGIIVLAGGSSSRLGMPKQSLLFKQTTLLQHSITAALASVAQHVVVVLGAAAETLHPVMAHAKLAVVVNEQWQEGMASSIRCGLQYLMNQQPGLQSAVFMVCDQPYISAALLNKLVTLRQETGHAVIASQYAEANGIPAIFDRQLFPELLQLKGDAGAKKLIMQQPALCTVPFPLGDIDIDTAADYHALQKT